jgi:hypothetical protein
MHSTSIATGTDDDHWLGIGDNRIFGWGANQVLASPTSDQSNLRPGAPGLLGRGKEVVMSATPMEITGFDGQVVDLACAATHSVVVTSMCCMQWCTSRPQT